MNSNSTLQSANFSEHRLLVNDALKCHNKEKEHIYRALFPLLFYDFLYNMCSHSGAVDDNTFV
jgi:hypothetical protein